MSMGMVGGSLISFGVNKLLGGGGGGGGGGGAPQVDLNRTFSSGNSTLRGGKLTLDPMMAGLRTNFLDRVNQVSQPGGNFDFGSRFGNLSQEFAGNQGSLINARMNPLMANIAQRRGGLQRDLGRRGVQGTFANQAMNNFEFGAGRELGDAQALATNDALMARTNLLGAEQGAEGALTQLLSGTNAQMLQQELASLGLGVDSISQLLGAQNSAARTNAVVGMERDKYNQGINAALAGSVGEGFTDYYNKPNYNSGSVTSMPSIFNS